jgi:hypothetical protein
VPDLSTQRAKMSAYPGSIETSTSVDGDVDADAVSMTCAVVRRKRGRPSSGIMSAFAYAAQRAKPKRRAKTDDELNDNGEYGKSLFACSHVGCGEVFTKKFSLNRHQKRHTGERPHKCAVCERAFSEKTTLRVRGRVPASPWTPCVPDACVCFLVVLCVL